MRMAEITCKTRMVRLPDLGIELLKGQKAHLTEKQVGESKDLALMRRINAVRLRWVRRGDLPDSSQPGHRPTTRTSGPRPNPPRSLPNAPTPPAKSPDVDLEALAEKLAAKMAPAVDRIVQAVKGSGGQQQVIVRTVAGVASGELPGIVVPEDGTPAFIPEKILNDSVKADIQTEKSISTGTGVQDAAAALKKARGGRKQTKET